MIWLFLLFAVVWGTWMLGWYLLKFSVWLWLCLIPLAVWLGRSLYRASKHVVIRYSA